MLDSWPNAHIGSDFAQNILNCHRLETVNSGKVDTCHTVQRLSQIEVWLVFASFRPARIWWWCARFIWQVEFLIQRFQLCITIPKLSVVEIVEFQCLLQRKQVFSFVVTFQ